MPTTNRTKTITVLVILLSLVAFKLLYDNETIRLVNEHQLAKSDVKALSVEYSNGKIYLNVELHSPTTCPKLVESLKIQSISIKTKTYQPICTEISNTKIRVTYSHLIQA